LYINDENELYEVEKGKEKSKLANDVVNVNGDYDEDVVTFQNADNDLYMVSGENEKEKIAANVTQYKLIGDNIYCLEDDGDFAMYNIKDKQESDLASDVADFTVKDGKVFFIDKDIRLKTGTIQPFSRMIKTRWVNIVLNIVEFGVYAVTTTVIFTVYADGDYEENEETFNNTYTVKNEDGDLYITDIKVSNSGTM